MPSLGVHGYTTLVGSSVGSLWVATMEILGCYPGGRVITQPIMQGLKYSDPFPMGTYNPPVEKNVVVGSR